MWSVNDGLALNPLGTFKNPPDLFRITNIIINNPRNDATGSQSLLTRIRYLDSPPNSTYTFSSMTQTKYLEYYMQYLHKFNHLLFEMVSVVTIIIYMW